MNKGVFAHGVIWFGAAVSVAEIEAGLQLGGNWAALVLGHLLGGILLFAAGLLGARSGENAMETTRSAFGTWGMRLLAVLNATQLVGWTAVMVSQGGAAVSELSGLPFVGCVLLLAALVAVWVVIGFDDRFHVTTVAVVLLAVLAAVLTVRLVLLPPRGYSASALGFWAAFELSVAMPLSWLPLVSDYTRRASRPVACTLASAATYTCVSVWMYLVGMLLTRSGAETLTAGVVKCGLGAVGLVVIAVSTVTTTFLDAYSGGESAKAIFPRIRPKPVGVAVCALGAILAMAGVADRYMDFLCLIASVFAPMSAVLLVNCYLVHRPCVIWNLVAWVIGVVTYDISSASPIGSALTAILVSGAWTCIPLFGRRLKVRWR